MRIICTAQHTAEWHSARTGICTASGMVKAMKKLSRKSKNGEAGDWAGDHWDYVSTLAWERITGQAADHYVSKPMEIGTQYEGEARVEYWMRTGTEVDETGLVLHPRFDYLGASPDGLVGKDGLVEIKVPLFSTHVGYLEAGEIPEEYQIQMQVQMLCCERKWNDFVSYCPPDIAPELPDEFRMFKKRLEADQTMFDAIEEAATVTMQHVAERMTKLRAMYPVKGAPKSKFRAELETAVLAQDLSDPADFAGSGYAFLDRNELERVP
jgi:putative phage-type endonuclease